MTPTPHNVVGGSPGDAVVCCQGEQQRAQDTAPRGACAEGDETGGVLSSISEEI